MSSINKQLWVSSQNWYQQVSESPTKNEKEAFPLNKIIRNFIIECEKNKDHEANLQALYEIAPKIKELSQEKLKFYQESRFGFIKKIFSILRNYIYHNRLVNSGSLGVQYTTDFIEKRNAAIKAAEERNALAERKTPIPEEKIDLKKASEEADILNGGIYYKKVGDKYESIGAYDTSDEIDSEESSDEKDEFVDATTGDEDILLPTMDDFKSSVVKEGKKKEKKEDVFFDAEEGDVEIEDSFVVNAEESIPAEQEIKTPVNPQVKSTEADMPLAEVKPVEVSKPSAPLSPKEEMLNTFENIWVVANDNEKTQIKTIWETMMKSAEVVNWTLIDEAKKIYQLELKKEMVGTHPDLLVGRLIIKKQMQISFEEKINLEKGIVDQEIAFLDKGLCYRVGWGIASKDTAVTKIVIQEDENNSITCTPHIMGRNVSLSDQAAINKFNAVTWT